MKTLFCRIPEGLSEKLREWAYLNRISQTQIVVQALQQYLKNEEGK